jgi:hypothetical protein
MPGVAMSCAELIVMAVLFALMPSAMDSDACESYFSLGKPVRSSEAIARSMERSAIPARRLPGDLWTCEMLFCRQSCLHGHMSSKIVNIQHAAKLASANKSDLDQLAAGFVLVEFG